MAAVKKSDMPVTVNEDIVDTTLAEVREAAQEAEAIVQEVMTKVEAPSPAEAETSWPPPLYVLRTAGESERFYMKYRWQAQWLYYDQKASECKKNYQMLQLVIGVGSVAVPVLLGFGGTMATVATVLSLVVAASAAIENVKKYGDSWRSYRQAAEQLQREKSMYDVSAGPYRSAKRPFTRFVERCEEIIGQQNGQFLQRPDDQQAQQQQAQQQRDSEG